MQPTKKHNSCLEGPEPHSDMAEDYHIGHLKKRGNTMLSYSCTNGSRVEIERLQSADTGFVKPSFATALNVCSSPLAKPVQRGRRCSASLRTVVRSEGSTLYVQVHDSCMLHNPTANPMTSNG